MFKIGQKRLKVLLFILCFTLLLSAPHPVALLADPVSEDMVTDLVEGWLDESTERLGEHFQGKIIDVIPYYEPHGEVAYYVVYLEPDGYVVVSADDMIEPILAFTDQGHYEADEQNPLYVLLASDTAERINLARNQQILASFSQVKGLGRAHALLESAGRSQKKWARLKNGNRSKKIKSLRGVFLTPGEEDLMESEPEASYEVDGFPSISDTRIAPLMGSRWNQGIAQGQYCYNYYTPNNYVSGCVATAIAQVMRYHEYPAAGIGQITKTVYIDGASASRTTRGGDGTGGAYDWSKMPLVPSSAPYDPEHWQMIGSLLYDTGIAVNMRYSSSGSGAYVSEVAPAFTDVFQYSSATTYAAWYYPLMQTPSVFRRILNSNLESDHPVLMAITGGGNHEVVVDGYGYDGGTMYHHVNMGWGGSNDAWYNLPNVDDSYYGFTSIVAITSNVFPEETGQIVCGRVLNEGGAPISGALVSAQPSGGGSTYTDTTDAKGYYGLVMPTFTTYNLTATADGYQPANLNGIAIPKSYPDGWSGNYYGAEITMQKWPGLTFRAMALQDSVVLRWSEPQDSGAANSSVHIRCSTTGYPAGIGDGSEVYTGTDLSYEHGSLVQNQRYYYTIWIHDGAGYVSPPGGSTINAEGTPDPGRLKVFFRNESDGSLNCWILSADGTKKSGRPVLENALSASWSVAGVGDIDQDGTDDLIMRNASRGLVNYWLLARDGTKKSGGPISESTLASTWDLAGVGDIDRDGTVDLIWRNETSGFVNYWLLASDGTKKSGGRIVDAIVPSSWYIAGMGDIDRDGTVDLIWRNETNGSVNYWLLASDGTRKSGGRVIESSLPAFWSVAGVGDIDQDETVDLIMRNGSRGLVNYWLLASDGTKMSGGLISESTLSSSWFVAGVGDIDEDGTIDLIWRDEGRGLLNYWLLNSDGTKRSGGKVIESTLSSSWYVAGVGN